MAESKSAALPLGYTPIFLNFECYSASFYKMQAPKRDFFNFFLCYKLHIQIKGSDMQKDTLKALSKITIRLHWGVAILMIAILASGIYMTRLEDYDIYPWHKSFGMLALFFAGGRLLWRFYNGWPLALGNYPNWEQFIAKLTHYLLISGTILMPISGMVMSSMSGRPLVFFGVTLFGPNLDQAGERIPRAEGLASFAHDAHEIAAYLIIVAILLHILGAFKHHIIYKDNTLKRMLGIVG